MLRLVLLSSLVVVGCDPDTDRRGRRDGGPDALADALMDDVALDGVPFDGGGVDGGDATDGGVDAGAVDSGAVDAGGTDSGPGDAGPRDAGPRDAGPRDAGPRDAGPRDAGPRDAGPPDGGPDTSCGAVCTFFPACGCGAQGCYVQDSGERVCAAPGVGTTGSACTTFDSCAEGLHCEALPTGEKQCTPVCQTDAQCPGAGAVCTRTTADPAVNVCSFHCQLHSQAGCPAQSYCLPLNGPGGTIVTDCRGPAGSSGRGSSCSSSADCQRGFTCARDSAGAPLRCRQWCRAGRDSDCDRSSDDCVSADPALRVGSQEYGICVP